MYISHQNMSKGTIGYVSKKISKKKYGLMKCVYGYENASKMNLEIFTIRNSCKNAVQNSH